MPATRQGQDAPSLFVGKRIGYAARMTATISAAPARASQAERRARSERGIIAAALDLIAERGLHGMTMAAVGERAGYSRALPAHLFGSRSALLCACVRRVIVEHWVESLPDPDAVDGLDAIMGAVSRWLGELQARSRASRAWFLLLHDAMTLDAEEREPELTRLVRSVVRGGEDRYRGYLAAAQQSGRVRASFDPEWQARMIHAVLTGISLRWLVNPESIDLGAFEAKYRAELARDLGSDQA